jgi:hypothetical protein
MRSSSQNTANPATDTTDITARIDTDYHGFSDGILKLAALVIGYYLLAVDL